MERVEDAMKSSIFVKPFLFTACLVICLSAQPAVASTVSLAIDHEYAIDMLKRENEFMMGLRESRNMHGLWFINTATQERLYLIHVPFVHREMTAMHFYWSGTTTALSGSPFTDVQKRQVQSLFDHAWYYAYGNGKNDDPANVFSLVLYAIFHLADAKGNLKTSLWPPDDPMMLRIKSYVNASITGDWSAFDYEKHPTNVTFYNLSSSVLGETPGMLLITTPSFHAELLVNDPAPIATPGGPYNCIVGESIQFSARGNDAWTYTWDFGDGTGGSGQTISHTYQATGTYED